MCILKMSPMRGQQLNTEGGDPVTDLKLLREKVEQSGLRASFIAEKLGISRTVWHQRCEGRTQFKKDEIITLRKLLRLTAKEFRAIFFALDVD